MARLFGSRRILTLAALTLAATLTGCVVTPAYYYSRALRCVRRVRRRQWARRARC